MHWAHAREIDGAPWRKLVAHFEQRPATWIRPFLQLAIQPADPSAAGHWYRLSAPDASLVAHFIWHPHGPDDLFSGFTGTLTLARANGGGRLTLDGEVTGGTPDRNDRALGTLLQLLAAALEQVNAPGS